MKPEIGRQSITALLKAHWSEDIQDIHDRRMGRRNAIGRDLIFRDLGAQAGRMHRAQEKAKLTPKPIRRISPIDSHYTILDGGSL